MQRYEKKCTYANLPEEKLHDSAFFSSRVAYGLARICGYATKKGNRVAIFFFVEWVQASGVLF